MINFYILIGGCPVWVGRRPADLAVQYSKLHHFEIMGSIAWKVQP